MPKNNQIRPIHLIKGLPNVLARIPAIFKSVQADRKKHENQSMPLCIEEVVAKYPDRPAIYFQDRTLTYAEFNAQANKIAHFLQSRGVKQGDVVALLMHNRSEFLINFTAIAKVGACAALLNHTQSGKVLAHSINLVSPVAAIIGEELVEQFNSVRGDIDIPEDQLYGVADSDVQKSPGTVSESLQNLMVLSADESTENLKSSQLITRSDHLCYIYTSGTTGMPKAAITDHNRFCKMIGSINVAMNLNKNDVFYLALPLYHATGLLACWGAVLASGSSVAIRRKFSASEFWDDIDKYQATIFGYVGEMCRYLLNQPSKPRDGQHTLTKIFGNGLRPGIWGDFKTRFKIPNILEFYGASEGNTGFVNLFNLDNTIGVGSATLVQYDREKDQVVRGSDGYLIPVEQGEPGLLIGEITEKTPFIGYTQKDKTEKAIFRDVFELGDAWFDTGDLLRNIGCAHYQFVDRLGDTFRWKGENVSTTQVENILSGHPAIADCVVYGVEIPGTNGKAGMASITPKEGHDLPLNELFEFASKNLPAYAVPIFLRHKQDVDTTGTFKYKKSDLKKESYGVTTCPDPVFVALPKTNHYVALTEKLQAEIDQGELAF
ncbi:MAG: long-chain-acyl-CoA synthetase [Gammaproteobacteria bacterium]|nr:MAG: long-chain-acyl-CoA synthetase [Gammaproteobacteria bacterium]